MPKSETEITFYKNVSLGLLLKVMLGYLKYSKAPQEHELGILKNEVFLHLGRCPSVRLSVCPYETDSF